MSLRSTSCQAAAILNQRCTQSTTERKTTSREKSVFAVAKHQRCIRPNSVVDGASNSVVMSMMIQMLVRSSTKNRVAFSSKLSTMRSR